MRLPPFFHIFILITFIFNSFGPIPSAQAQDFLLPKPGVMVHLSPPMNPPMLKGVKVHTDNPFRFDFILDKGDSKQNNDQLKDESSKLIKYFLASLTIPEKDLWVNLSPYEKDRIIPQSFGLTEMGRDLLAEDYILKQVTASLIYPEDEIGKKFWKRIYEESQKKYGTTNIPINTFNKVWILPEKAVVYENGKAGTAYVVESKLKVMLEQDYLSLEKHEGTIAPLEGKETNKIASQIVREIVIPELAKEVNEGKNFAQLRQVYNSLILATWYKKKIKDSILFKVYADKRKVIGINIEDPKEKERIYQQYLQAFKKGVYNYIKEEPNLSESEPTITRKYFSGGLLIAISDKAMSIVNDLSLPEGDFAQVTTDLAMLKQSSLPEVDGAMNADLTIDEFYKDIHTQLIHKSNGWQVLKKPVSFQGWDDKTFGQFKQSFQLENGHKPGVISIGLGENVEQINVIAVQMEDGKVVGMEWEGKKPNENELVHARLVKEENGYKTIDQLEYSHRELYNNIRAQMEQPSLSGWQVLRKPVDFQGWYGKVDGNFQRSFQLENGYKPGMTSMLLNGLYEQVDIVEALIRDGQICGIKLRGSKEGQIAEAIWSSDSDLPIESKIILDSSENLGENLNNLYINIRTQVSNPAASGWQVLRRPVSFQGWYYENDGQFKNSFQLENGHKPGKITTGLGLRIKEIEVIAVQMEDGKVVGMEWEGKKPNENKLVHARLVKEGDEYKTINQLEYSHRELYNNIRAQMEQPSLSGWQVLRKPVSFERWLDENTKTRFPYSFQLENGHKPGVISIGLGENVEQINVIAVQMEDGKVVGMEWEGKKPNENKLVHARLVKEGDEYKTINQLGYSLMELYDNIRAQMEQPSLSGWQVLKKPVSFQGWDDKTFGQFKQSFQLENGHKPGQKSTGLGLDVEEIQVIAVQMEDGKVVGMEWEGKKPNENELVHARLVKEESGYKTINQLEYSLMELYDNIRAQMEQPSLSGWQVLRKPVDFQGWYHKAVGQFKQSFQLENGYKPGMTSMLLNGLYEQVDIVEALIRDGQICGIKLRGSKEGQIAEAIWPESERVVEKPADLLEMMAIAIGHSKAGRSEASQRAWDNLARSYFMHRHNFASHTIEVGTMLKLAKLIIDGKIQGKLEKWGYVPSGFGLSLSVKQKLNTILKSVGIDPTSVSFQAWMLDFSKEMHQLIKQEFNQSGIVIHPQQVDVINQVWEIEDGHLDVVEATELVTFSQKENDQGVNHRVWFLSEANRVLREGGILLVSSPSHGVSEQMRIALSRNFGFEAVNFDDQRIRFVLDDLATPQQEEKIKNQVRQAGVVFFIKKETISHDVTSLKNLPTKDIVFDGEDKVVISTGDHYLREGSGEVVDLKNIPWENVRLKETSLSSPSSTRPDNASSPSSSNTTQQGSAPSTPKVSFTRQFDSTFIQGKQEVHELLELDPDSERNITNLLLDIFSVDATKRSFNWQEVKLKAEKSVIVLEKLDKEDLLKAKEYMQETVTMAEQRLGIPNEWTSPEKIKINSFIEIRKSQIAVLEIVLADSSQLSELGGIDLTTDNMDLKVQGNGADAMMFSLTPELVQQFENASGFRPVIIHFEPSADLRNFLEIK